MYIHVILHTFYTEPYGITIKSRNDIVASTSVMAKVTSTQFINRPELQENRRKTGR